MTSRTYNSVADVHSRLTLKLSSAVSLAVTKVLYSDRFAKLIKIYSDESLDYSNECYSGMYSTAQHAEDFFIRRDLFIYLFICFPAYFLLFSEKKEEIA